MNTIATTSSVTPSTPNPKQPQQRQTAKEIIAANVKELIAQLEAGHSNALTAYLDAMSRFHNYSFGNVLEIARQRPDATRVAGLYAWNQLGRKVKKGEKGSWIEVALQDIFGATANAPICWKRVTAHSDSHRWGIVHDMVLWRAKTDQFHWRSQFEPYDQSYIESHYSNRTPDGRRYTLGDLSSPNPRPNLTYTWRGCEPPKNGWRYELGTMEKLFAEGKIELPKKSLGLGRAIVGFSTRAKVVPWVVFGPISFRSILRRRSELDTIRKSPKHSSSE